MYMCCFVNTAIALRSQHQQHASMFIPITSILFNDFVLRDVVLQDLNLFQTFLVLTSPRLKAVDHGYLYFCCA